jgi:hypothetical protein
MSRIFLKGTTVLCMAGLMLMSLSACSENKEAVKAPAPEKPAAAAAEPVPPPAPVLEAVKPAPEASAAPEKAVPSAPPPPPAGAVAVRARFDGYASQVARSLWQPVPLAAEPANFALVTPLEPIRPDAGLFMEEGPEGLALGTQGGMLKSTDGRPLLVGAEYTFLFRKDGDAVWTVEINRLP